MQGTTPREIKRHVKEYMSGWMKKIQELKGVGILSVVKVRVSDCSGYVDYETGVFILDSVSTLRTLDFAYSPSCQRLLISPLFVVPHLELVRIQSRKPGEEELFALELANLLRESRQLRLLYVCGWGEDTKNSLLAFDKEVRECSWEFGIPFVPVLRVDMGCYEPSVGTGDSVYYDLLFSMGSVLQLTFKEEAHADVMVLLFFSLCVFFVLVRVSIDTY